MPKRKGNGVPSVGLLAFLGFSQAVTLEASTMSIGVSPSLALLEPLTVRRAQCDLLRLGVRVFGGAWMFKVPETVIGRVRGVALGA